MKPMTPMRPMEVQQWWPDGFGEPAAAGSQNDLKYAYFSVPRRLAVHRNGKTTIYDTGEHLIRGVSQHQRDNDGGATFTSQDGEVRLDELKVVGR